MEAGDEEPVIADVPGLATPFVTQSSIDYGYFTNPEPSGNFIGRKTRFRYPRGKVMGGTSSINGMIYNRGNKWDYDNWHRLGNEGWSWNDVLPYFVKSEGARDPWVTTKIVKYFNFFYTFLKTQKMFSGAIEKSGVARD